MHSFYQALKFNFRCWYSGRLDYPSHLHNHIELVYLLEGNCNISIDGVDYLIQSGDIVTIFPNQLHRYTSIDDKNGIILLLSPEYLTEYTEAFRSQIPTSSVLKHSEENDALLPIFKQLVEEHNQPTTYSEPIIKGSLLYLMGNILRRVCLSDAADARQALAVIRILNFCHSHYTQDILLDDLAAALHLSRYYISHVFTHRLYIGFPEYINSLRVSYACELLKDTKHSMTEISQKVGFNNIRSFNRAFQKFQGYTPREYRRQMQSLNESDKN